MKNLKEIICVLVGVLYISLVTNVVFAVSGAVETEPKEQVPVENVTPTPIPLPEPPFELDNETKTIIIDLLAKEFNKTADEIEILSAGKTHEEGRIAVRTNLGVFTYKNGAIYPTGIRFEPKVNGTEALEIVKLELSNRGLDVESTVFYTRYSRSGLLGDSLCGLRYEKGYDINFYPTNYSCSFYFLKSLDEEKAVYEEWRVKLDSNIGEIISLVKEKTATFYNMKTHEMAANYVGKEKGIKVEPTSVSLYLGHPGTPPQWTVGDYILYDDGRIEEKGYGAGGTGGNLEKNGVASVKSYSNWLLVGLGLLVSVLGIYFYKRRGSKDD